MLAAAGLAAAEGCAAALAAAEDAAAIDGAADADCALVVGFELCANAGAFAIAIAIANTPATPRRMQADWIKILQRRRIASSPDPAGEPKEKAYHRHSDSSIGTESDGVVLEALLTPLVHEGELRVRSW